MVKFKSFPGPHPVIHPIEGGRVATAWIGKDVIYGGEITGHTSGVDAHSVFHPVTVQWQAPNGTIGWIQLSRSPMIDAKADKTGFSISANGDVTFRIHAPGIAASDTLKDQWSLAGLTVHVNSNAKSFSAEQNGPFVDVRYLDMTSMTLNMEPTVAKRRRSALRHRRHPSHRYLRSDAGKISRAGR